MNTRSDTFVTLVFVGVKDTGKKENIIKEEAIQIGKEIGYLGRENVEILPNTKENQRKKEWQNLVVATIAMRINKIKEELK